MNRKLISFVLVALVAGCQSNPSAKEPSVHELGMRQWDSTRADVLLSLAGDQYKTGNFEKCRETLGSALKLDPANPQTHMLSARLYIEQGQLELAEKDLDVARAADPNGAQEDYLSGIIFQRWQQAERAQAYYDSACSKAPMELAYLMGKAEMMVSQGHPAEALTLLQSRITYFEHSAAIRDAAGMLLLQQHRTADAVEMFRRATILSTDDQTIREHLATALFQNKQFVEAVDELASLLKDDAYARRADLYLTLGQCQLEIGQPNAARDAFQKAIDLDSSLPAAWLALARMAMQANDLRRAEVCLDHAQTLAPANNDTCLLLGYLRLRQGRLDEAVAAFHQASQLDDHDTVSLCMIGYVLEKEHHADQAKRYFDAALQISPSDEMARDLMADANIAGN